MEFWKMSGTGNDFILLDNWDGRLSPERLALLSRHLCRRRRSIGADGLIAAERPAAGGDLRMRFFNADGSQGEMCGNGGRCICRYGYETGRAGPQQRVETPAGMVTGWRIGPRDHRIRLNDPTAVELERTVSVRGRRYDVSYVELGDPGLPHAVVPLPGLTDAREETLRRLGRSLRHHPAFPRGANVNFYDLLPDGTVFVRTFERGVEDFTLSCGTGSSCVAAVLTLKGVLGGEDLPVRTPGGMLRVDVPVSGGAAEGLYLTGETNIVCKGTVTDEDLPL